MLGLGVAIGTVVAIMSWSQNQTPNVVSVFPDGRALIVLIVALAWGQRLHMRVQHARTLRASLTGILAMALAAGCVLWVAVAVSGLGQYSNPSVLLTGIGFLMAVVSTMTCAAAVGLVTWALSRSSRTA